MTLAELVQTAQRVMRENRGAGDLHVSTLSLDEYGEIMLGEITEIAVPEDMCGTIVIS